MMLGYMKFPERCSKCFYRANDTSGHTCDYLTITGHARIKVSPAAGDKCTAYRPRVSGRNRVSERRAIITMPHKHNERTQIRYRQMREMWEQGWTDGKIADELGISKHTVKRWRLGECLQPNKARKEVV